MFTTFDPNDPTMAPTGCVSCDPTKNEVFIDTLGTCGTDCGDFRFKGEDKCEQCSLGCKTCNNDMICDGCEDGWSKVVEKDDQDRVVWSGCVPECWDNHFTNANGVCEQCADPHCKECSDKTTCVEPFPGFLLEQGTVVPKDQVDLQGKFIDGVEIKACDPSCGNCKREATMCTSCKQASPPTFLNPVQNTCGPDCPTGTFKNSTSFRCQPCLNNAQECDSAG